MRIKKIEEIGYRYHVFLEPNWIESLFGVRPKIQIFRDSGRRYTFGGGGIYIRQDGEQTGNGSYIGEALDKKRRSFK